MVDWDPTELAQIATAPEIEVSSLREDGALTKPVTIWAVQVDGELYVRSVRGAHGGWYKAVEQRQEGRIEVGDTAVDVALNPVDSITTGDARATTTRVAPR